MFRVPFSRVRPNYGNQLVDFGQGGPSGDFAIKATTPIAWPYGSGWQNTFAVSTPGRALSFVSPALVQQSLYPNTTIVQGIEKTPGSGMINV